jgi:large subunit ribosomal protein L4
LGDAMKVKVHGNSKSLELTDTAFGAKFNESLVHQVVTAYLARARQGTKAQKSRSDARGGGAKPWRQKGTGRARAGTSRSPIWTGGGRTFAARPRDHAQKVNRKMYRGALRAILSELFRRDRVTVIEALAVAEPKTRELKAQLKALDVDSGALIVEAFDENLWLAARNLPNLEVLEVSDVNPVSLVRADKIVMTAAAAKLMEERLA